MSSVIGSARVEVLHKETNQITEWPLREWLATSGRGVKGQLNTVLDLCDGQIFQNLNEAIRLKGLSLYAWDWNK